MYIKYDIIPKGMGVRCGKKLTACRGLVVHWIGVPQARAEVIRRNFERQTTGAHYISDWNDGGIIQCVPEDEVCYHVGANTYTTTKQAICGGANPNWYLVGIECCIDPATAIPGDYAAAGKYMDMGRPSDAQYQGLVAFAADFLRRHHLTVDNLYRHYDITHKACPIWFVKDSGRWRKFKADVAAEMEGEEMTQEQFNAMFEKAVQAHADKVNAQPVSSWAAEAWAKAKAEGVFDGTMPRAALTREQAAVILSRVR